MHRESNILVAIQVVFVILLDFSTSWAGNQCGLRVNLPVVEVKELVRLWAKGRGCEISGSRSKDGASVWSLDISCGLHQDVRLDITPDSVLGAYVAFKSNGQEAPCQWGVGAELVAFLKSRVSREDEKETHWDRMVKSPKRPIDTCRSPILNDYKALVACITVIDQGKGIQVSGIYLGKIRAVLTTAHGLDSGAHVKVNFLGGKGVLGCVTYLDRSKDLALIELSQPLQGHYPPLKWRHKPLTTEEWIYYLGCPMGRGLVCQKGKVEIPRNMDGQLLWQVSMEVEPGSSGSPVFDEKGRFVGVIKGRLRENHYQGFVIPVDTVEEYIASVAEDTDNRDGQQYRLPIFRHMP